MSEKLRVVFNSPQCGWMSFELRAGEQSLAETVSYTPYDSLVDLINALIVVLNDEEAKVTVTWAHEPDELDFNFSASGERATLEVEWYRDRLRAEGTGERVFFFQGSRLDVCRSFRKALSDLESDVEVDEFKRNWRREFPAPELRRLADEIRAYEQKQAQATGSPVP